LRSYTLKKGFELMQYAIFQIMRCEMHRAVEAVYTKLHREGVTLL